jgi:hypothetical protein
LVDIEADDNEIEFSCKSCKSIKKSPYVCQECSNPIWGISQKFYKHLEKFVAGGKKSSKKYRKIYNLRSKIVHQGRLFLSDYELSFRDMDKKEDELIMKIETLQVVRVTDFDIKDDVIYVADSQSMRVTSYSIETGENIDTFSLENRPMRVTCLKDGFIVQWLGNDLLFSKFDYEGNEILQFGEIVEDQFQHQMSLDGTIRSNRNDRFVYIPLVFSPSEESLTAYLDKYNLRRICIHSVHDHYKYLMLIYASYGTSILNT